MRQKAADRGRDTGFGGLINIHHTVSGYEEAGVQAIQLENQESPKKCGHTPNRRSCRCRTRCAASRWLSTPTARRRSWLMDGLTPVADVLRVIGADGATLPQRGQYDTLAGLLMALLRRLPRRTDCAEWGGFRFEVLDVDSLRIDQVLVTAMAAGDPPPPAPARDSRT